MSDVQASWLSTFNESFVAYNDVRGRKKKLPLLACIQHLLRPDCPLLLIVFQYASVPKEVFDLCVKLHARVKSRHVICTAEPRNAPTKQDILASIARIPLSDRDAVWRTIFGDPSGCTQQTTSSFKTALRVVDEVLLTISNAMPENLETHSEEFERAVLACIPHDPDCVRSRELCMQRKLRTIDGSVVHLTEAEITTIFRIMMHHRAKARKNALSVEG